MKSNSWLYQYYSLHSKMHYTMQQSSSTTPASPSAANVSTSSTGSNSTSNVPLSSESPSVSSLTCTSVSPSTTCNANSNSSMLNYEIASSSTTPSTITSSSSSTTSPTARYVSSNYSSSYGNTGSTSTLLNSSLSASSLLSTTTEAPTAAAATLASLHHNHPGSHSINYNNYNHNGNNTGSHVSINTAAATSPSTYPLHPHHAHHPHYNQFGSSHAALQQYSPQAGSLPYQIVGNNNSITANNTQQPILSPNTPQANQTEARIKEERATPASRPSNKRTRSSSNQQEEESGNNKKSHKKKNPGNNNNNNNHANNNNNHGATNAAYAGYPTNGATSYHAYQSNTSVHHHHYHSAYYHHHAAGGYSTDLSSMMPAAYYGGPMSYHSQLSAAYHHHQSPFQSKFSFFEPGTAATTGQGSTNYTTNTTTDNSRSEEPTLLSSYQNSLAFSHTGNQVAKNVSAFLGTEDRRELEKMKSPESIASATSDYGSMTSQSPPSTFDHKTYPTLLSANGSELFEQQNSGNNNQYKNAWASHYAQTAAVGGEMIDQTSATATSLPFSRLSTFQFWPGYSATAAVTPSAALAGEEAMQQTTRSSNATVPPVGSAFPSVDHLLSHHSSGQAASVYGHSHHQSLFSGYPENYDTMSGSTASKPLVNRSSASRHSTSSNKTDASGSKSLADPSPCTSPSNSSTSKLSTQSVISVSRAL